MVLGQGGGSQGKKIRKKKMGSCTEVMHAKLADLLVEKKEKKDPGRPLGCLSSWKQPKNNIVRNV